MTSLLQRRRLHLSAVKKSSGVLHRPTRKRVAPSVAERRQVSAFVAS